MIDAALDDVDDALAVYDQARGLRTPGAPTPPPARLPGMPWAVPPPTVATAPTEAAGAPLPPPAETQAPARRAALDPELANRLRRASGNYAREPGPEQGGDTNRALKVLQGFTGALAGTGYDSEFWASRDAERERKRREQFAAADADSASDRSQRARTAMAPMLMKLGLEPDEIAGLSAADIGALTKGGNLVTGVAKARAAARAAEAARAQKEADLKEKREYDEAQEKEQRHYDETVKQGQRLDVARAGSALAGGRQIQGLLLSDELARRRAAEEAARKGGEKVVESAKDYGIALQKTNIPKAEEKIRKVEQLSAKLREKHGGRLFSEADDLKRRGADLFNKPEAYNLLSDPDARELMRNVQELRNIQIKDQAGGNVTDSEFGRQQVAMGNSALADADSITRWASGMRNGLQADRDNLLGAFGPDAAAQYERNLAAAKAPKAASVPEGRVRVRLKNGKVGTVPADQTDHPDVAEVLK